MDIDKIAFTVFGLDISWYGIMTALGAAVCAVFAYLEAKRRNVEAYHIMDAATVALLSGIVGARLFYALFNLQFFRDNPIHILYIWEPGRAMFGAFIGAMAGLFILCRIKKLSFALICDIFAPGLAIAQSIGRWGNFFNQEAFGPAVTNPKLMWFPFAVKIDRPWADGFHLYNGAECQLPWHMATFFYESIWCLLIFFILWILRKKFKHPGDCALTYYMLYGFGRMFLEILRGDSLWLVPGVIKVSQLMSFAMFVCILVFFIIRRYKEKHKRLFT